ncbi:MAG: hypothetical protein JO110_07380 [Acetobacteraceae bacterium]|nr:hypothetical protein [Acetobacteraceae bacterium]
MALVAPGPKVFNGLGILLNGGPAIASPVQPIDIAEENYAKIVAGHAATNASAEKWG